MIYFSLCILFSWMLLLNGNKLDDKPIKFSGFFTPDTSRSASDFAASFLISRERFILTETSFQESSGIAGVTFAAVRKFCANCAAFATRDFFDFFVEHLSPYSNFIPSERPELAQTISKKSEYRSFLYRNQALTTPHPGIYKRLYFNNTLGIIPFSSKAFSKDDNLPYQDQIRKHYFELTFWSVFQYYRNIVVITSAEDLPFLNELNLPIYDTIIVSNPPLSSRNKTDTLPRLGINQVIQQMKSNTKQYQSFKFIFYTEGDQIVHIRGIENIYDFMFESQRNFVAVPHRFQSFLLSSEFTPEYYKYFQTKDYLHLHLSASTVSIQEPIFEPVGSCCEDGLYEIENCKYGWWYQCHEWGIKDMFPWFRFGESGFPIPPVTEHRRSCQYYPTRTTCDMPVTCEERTPSKKQFPYVHASQLCKPYDVIKYLGPTNHSSSSSKSFNDVYHDRLYQLEIDERELRKTLTEASKLRKRIKQSKKTLKTLLTTTNV